MYEIYFVRRLAAELQLANETDDLQERAIHLLAVRYYQDLLGVSEELTHAAEAADYPAETRQRRNRTARS